MPPLKKQILQQFGNQKLLTEFLLLRINSKKIISDYLGKLITYLRAMQAQKAVWIFFYPHSGHIAAINWLIKSNNSDFSLLKIEAIGIGESNPAPILNLIVGSSEIRKSACRINRTGKTPINCSRHGSQRWRNIQLWNFIKIKLSDVVFHIGPVVQRLRGSYFYYRVRKNYSFIDRYTHLDSSKKGRT